MLFQRLSTTSWSPEDYREHWPITGVIDDFLESLNEKHNETARRNREELERKEREKRERTVGTSKSSKRYGWHSGMDTL